MRTTVTLDDELLKEAETATGIKGRTALIQAGLQLLVQREASRRLARMGGSQPDLVAPPRRRLG